MSIEDYRILSRALTVQIRSLAEKAQEIITQIVEKDADENGYITRTMLYGNVTYPLYLFLDEYAIINIHIDRETKEINLRLAEYDDYEDTCDESKTHDWPLCLGDYLGLIDLADYLTHTNNSFYKNL